MNVVLTIISNNIENVKLTFEYCQPQIEMTPSLPNKSLILKNFAKSFMSEGFYLCE